MGSHAKLRGIDLVRECEAVTCAECSDIIPTIIVSFADVSIHVEPGIVVPCRRAANIFQHIGEVQCLTLHDGGGSSDRGHDQVGIVQGRVDHIIGVVNVAISKLEFLNIGKLVCPRGKTR